MDQVARVGEVSVLCGRAPEIPSQRPRERPDWAGLLAGAAPASGCGQLLRRGSDQLALTISGAQLARTRSRTWPRTSARAKGLSSHVHVRPSVLIQLGSP